MSVAHALLRATSALVPTFGGGHGAMRKRFLPVPAHSFRMGSHRRLPHIYPQDRWLFLTWHLYGSLPQAQYPPPHHLSAGRAFIWIVTLTGPSGGLGFFSMSPSPRSSLLLCGAACWANR